MSETKIDRKRRAIYRKAKTGVEAARLAGISQSSWHAWCKKNRLPAKCKRGRPQKEVPSVSRTGSR